MKVMRSSRSLHLASASRAAFSTSMMNFTMTKAGATKGIAAPMSESCSNVRTAVSTTGFDQRETPLRVLMPPPTPAKVETMPSLITDESPDCERDERAGGGGGSLLGLEKVIFEDE